MAEQSPPLALCLFDDFELVAGEDDVEMPGPAQRCVAYLAIHDGLITRCRIANDLWPDVPLATGLTRLRDAVYRIRQVTPTLLQQRGHRLSIADGVRVDIRQMMGLAAAVINAEVSASGVKIPDLTPRDVLPMWDEPWLEALRQEVGLTCARALEYLAHDRIDAERFNDAEQACRLVIAAEPFRESAHLLLAQVHIAEGNPALALRTVQDYERRVLRDLGCAPSRAVQYVERSIRESTLPQYAG
ncbi:MAG: bacterial transcriptional activator domain-containing protein [Ornithinimicrobium sp.]